MKYNITDHWVDPISSFRKFLPIIDKADCTVVKRLKEQTDEAQGTPQEPANWKDPSQWIPRLSKDKTLDLQTAQLAEKINRVGLNPRWWNYDKARIVMGSGLEI
jgi:hypothetical protein